MRFSRTLKNVTLVSAMALGGAWSMTVSAGTATANLSASATVTNNCTISAAPLSFTYDSISANATSASTAEANFTVKCTKDATTTIDLGEGANADTGSTAAAPLRRLKDSGTNYLTYSLYSDSARSATWGTGTTVDAEHTGTGADATITVYGSVASAQNVPAGSYSDTIVATINF